MTSHVAVFNRSIKAAFCSLLNPSRCSTALLIPLFCLDHLCSVLMPASVSPMTFSRCFSRFAGTNRMIQTGLRVAVSALIIDARSSCGSVWFSAALLTPLVHDNDVFHRSSLDRQEHLPVISSC